MFNYKNIACMRVCMYHIVLKAKWIVKGDVVCDMNGLNAIGFCFVLFYPYLVVDLLEQCFVHHAKLKAN